ncbi:MAG: UDP-N-acetylglucosamine 2-epimerase (non-hydrolyzing), partial [Candidatus Bathyarchaeota archaeon]|nr:UDP-N-acetylglucosamine 2-epimerase (non-hydrolyzing) [Candidatus Termiticorpusculum sp.]
RNTKNSCIYRRLLSDEIIYVQMAKAANPYGDGKASQRICQAIAQYFRCENKKCSFR